ncbi:hypothetical protein E4U12_006358 [Claviceps purpurea]|nr:hypothetical protein E4U12_006358 [Claviceps purpurea]
MGQKDMTLSLASRRRIGQRTHNTNDQVNTYNGEHLEKIQKPIINIACSSTGREDNAAASRSNAQAQLLWEIAGLKRLAAAFLSRLVEEQTMLMVGF